MTMFTFGFSLQNGEVADFGGFGSGTAGEVSITFNDEAATSFVGSFGDTVFADFVNPIERVEFEVFGVNGFTESGLLSELGGFSFTTVSSNQLNFGFSNEFGLSLSSGFTYLDAQVSDDALGGLLTGDESLGSLLDNFVLSEASFSEVSIAGFDADFEFLTGDVSPVPLSGSMTYMLVAFAFVAAAKKYFRR